MNDDNSGHPEIPVTAESLDSATISGIEALHAAVLKAEAEQRFGLLRGRRSKQLTEAEEAENEFLERNGFATYNDFRLRVRRSTPAPPPPPPLPAPVVTEAAASIVGPGTPVPPGFIPPVSEDDTIPSGTVPAGAPIPGGTTPDPGPDTSPFEPGASAVETGTPVDEPGASAAAAVPAPGGAAVVTPLPAVEPDGDQPISSQEGSAMNYWSQPGSAPTGPSGPTTTVGPPASTPAAPPADGAPEATKPAMSDFRVTTDSLLTTLQAETSKFVAAQLDAADRQAAEIVKRASKEGSELIARAARIHEAVKVTVDKATHQYESLLAILDDLPTRIAVIRQEVVADIENLRHLTDHETAESPEAATGEPMNTTVPHPPAS